MYAPIIKAARRVREHALGPDHSAVLLTDIESDPRGPSIVYAHLLVVFRSGETDPIAFISSEAAAVDDEFMEEMDLEPADMPAPEGSHFLCAFVEDGHKNFGASNDWADLVKFERAALDAVKRMGLAPVSPDLLASLAAVKPAPAPPERPTSVLGRLFSAKKDGKR